jgi:hypothetical protein
MKVHRVEVLVIDFDELGADAVGAVLESTRYPNRCISPRIITTRTYDVGEWDDSHPLNQTNTDIEHYLKDMPLAP